MKVISDMGGFFRKELFNLKRMYNGNTHNYFNCNLNNIITIIQG
jgi:hypothetical protein